MIRKLLQLAGAARWITVRVNGRTELLTKNMAMKLILSSPK